MKKTRENYESKTSLEVVTALSSMEEASKILWRCDPVHHEEGGKCLTVDNNVYIKNTQKINRIFFIGKTYIAFTRLLQGYIENEVDMNDDNTCRENCAHYQVAKHHGCYKEQYCSRQPPCTGKILSCRYVDSDMWICPSVSES